MKGKDDQGRWIYYQQGSRGKVEKELGYQLSDCVGVEEGEKVPDSAPCEKCKKDIEVQSAEVERGGVYFKCVGCGARGVIKAEAAFAKQVREIQQRNDNKVRKIVDGWWTTASQLRGNDKIYLKMGTEITCKMHVGAV